MPRGAFYLLFVVSGFAGLIYESIWSHYLKLFLGHAAYAQSLVLAVFMFWRHRNNIQKLLNGTEAGFGKKR